MTNRGDQDHNLLSLDESRSWLDRDYYGKCRSCGCRFIGWKLAPFCKVCDQQYGVIPNSHHKDDDMPSRDEAQKRADELGVPLIKPLSPAQRDISGNPVVAVCGECGREVRLIEGYSCCRDVCPIQTRPTMFSGSS